MGLLEDMKSLITTETNEYIGDMPDTPDNLICLYHSGGYDPELTLDKTTIRRPTFQVRVRDTAYSTAMSRIEAIRTALTMVTNTTVNGSFYIEILQLGDIQPLGRDSRNRWEFTINFKVRTR